MSLPCGIWRSNSFASPLKVAMCKSVVTVRIDTPVIVLGPWARWIAQDLSRIYRIDFSPNAEIPSQSSRSMRDCAECCSSSLGTLPGNEIIRTVGVTASHLEEFKAALQVFIDLLQCSTLIGRVANGHSDECNIAVGWLRRVTSVL